MIESKALHDPSSQSSFITEKLVDGLRYNKNNILKIFGISNTCLNSNKVVVVKVHSKLEINENIFVYGAVLSQITCNTPSYR